jgi:CBS domain-containing protein
MDQVRARDIMSTKLTVVAPRTGIDKIAAMMALKMISAVPVVDEQFRLLGIVSEGDLLVRDESGTLPRSSWWLRLFGDSDELARRYAKTHGLTAEDVMVRDVVCATPDTTAREIADTMVRRSIKRLPVIENGQLVGIVSRADIVQMIAIEAADRKAARRADREIQDEVLMRFCGESWAETRLLTVGVREGTVELSGLVASNDQKKALQVLTSGVPGVKRVVDLTRVISLAAL